MKQNENQFVASEREELGSFNLIFIETLFPLQHFPYLLKIIDKCDNAKYSKAWFNQEKVSNKMKMFHLYQLAIFMHFAERRKFIELENELQYRMGNSYKNLGELQKQSLRRKKRFQKKVEQISILKKQIDQKMFQKYSKQMKKNQSQVNPNPFSLIGGLMAQNMIPLLSDHQKQHHYEQPHQQNQQNQQILKNMPGVDQKYDLNVNPPKKEKKQELIQSKIIQSSINIKVDGFDKNYQTQKNPNQLRSSVRIKPTNSEDKEESIKSTSEIYSRKQTKILKRQTKSVKQIDKKSRYVESQVKSTSSKEEIFSQNKNKVSIINIGESFYQSSQFQNASKFTPQKGFRKRKVYQ